MPADFGSDVTKMRQNNLIKMPEVERKQGGVLVEIEGQPGGQPDRKRRMSCNARNSSADKEPSRDDRTRSRPASASHSKESGVTAGTPRKRLGEERQRTKESKAKLPVAPVSEYRTKEKRRSIYQDSNKDDSHYKSNSSISNSHSQVALKPVQSEASMVQSQSVTGNFGPKFAAVPRPNAQQPRKESSARTSSSARKRQEETPLKPANYKKVESKIKDYIMKDKVNYENDRNKFTRKQNAEIVDYLTEDGGNQYEQFESEQDLRDNEGDNESLQAGQTLQNSRNLGNTQHFSTFRTFEGVQNKGLPNVKATVVQREPVRNGPVNMNTYPIASQIKGYDNSLEMSEEELRGSMLSSKKILNQGEARKPRQSHDSRQESNNVMDIASNLLSSDILKRFSGRNAETAKVGYVKLTNYANYEPEPAEVRYGKEEAISSDRFNRSKLSKPISAISHNLLRTGAQSRIIDERTDENINDTSRTSSQFSAFCPNEEMKSKKV